MGVTTEQNPTAMDTSTSEKTFVIVFNSCLYPTPPAKVEIGEVNLSDTLKTIRQAIADKLGYSTSAFDMTLRNKKITEQDDEKILRDFNVITAKVAFTITKNVNAKENDFGKDGPKVFNSNSSSVRLPSANSPSTGAANGSIGSNSGSSVDGHSTALITYGPPTEAGAASSYRSNSYSGSSTYQYTDWNAKSQTGFVGLSNQGATCYMNSLIQSLYMTPEFRAALYKWNFNETWDKRERERREKSEKADKAETTEKTEKSEKTEPVDNQSPEERKKQFEKDSIPRQLQLLFARLQLRDQRAVKTKELTNSFGWKESDAFTQHDVQELCRVLFDALEKVLKGTEQENLINELYQGEMKDYVRCKECNHESSRSDKYLDIPLVIRGFGATTAIKSVEEALAKFVQPEILEGENQYKCEKCNKKVDAVKGLKFVTFPYLLTMQLKRFDFDYETFRRIKLNDRVTFPMILDMNQFLHDYVPPTTEKPSKRKRDLAKGDDEDDEMEEDVPEQSDGKSEQTDSDMSNNNSSNVTGKGPYNYELYSVLVHRGSALGGHYYAYIKSFEKNKWYEFNDSSVSEIDEDDIKKTFGEEERPRGAYSQYFYSSANAYMLMYRRIDTSKNKIAVKDEEVPIDLKNKLDEEISKHKRKTEERERERDMIKLRVFYEMIEKEVKLHKNTTMADTLKACAESFGLNSRFAPDCIRLRNFQTYNSIPQEPYDAPELQDKSLENLRFYSSKSVIIETKQEGESFPEYNPSDILIRVIQYDHRDNKFLEPRHINVDKDSTLADLKKVIAAKFGIPMDKQRLVREMMTYTNNGPCAKVLIGDDLALRLDHKVYEATKVYLEYCTDPESESPSFAEIDRTRNMLEIKFSMPDKEDCDQPLQVSKKLTYIELKKMISKVVNLPVDEFRVSRGSPSWKIEIKGDNDSLDDCRISDGTRLYVEKGKPLKDGETKIHFYVFDPVNKRTKDYFEELFEFPVSEEILISDLKELLAKKLKEDKNIEVDPKKLRIREMFSRTPSKIYKDKETLKQSCNVLYSGKTLAVQELDAEEDVSADKDIAIFLQQFSPSKFELGTRSEIKISEDLPIVEFKNQLAEKYGIKNVGIAKAMGSWPGTDVLEIPDLYWDREIPENTTYRSGTMGTSPLYLRDGDILYFRDNDEPQKELSKEEKRKMEKDAQIKRRGNYYAKEEALTINAKV